MHAAARSASPAGATRATARLPLGPFRQSGDSSRRHYRSLGLGCKWKLRRWSESRERHVHLLQAKCVRGSCAYSRTGSILLPCGTARCHPSIFRSWCTGRAFPPPVPGRTGSSRTDPCCKSSSPLTGTRPPSRHSKDRFPACGSGKV